MWARIMGEQLVEIINRPKSMTINDIQYPKSIFSSAYTVDERKALGIVPYVYTGNSLNSMFYKTSEASPTVESDKVVVSRTQTALNIDNIKATMKDNINSVLSSTLAETDWYHIRKIETDEAIPAAVSKWRSDLRAKAIALESAIDAKTDVAGLEAMTVITEEMFDAGKKASEFHDWPRDPRKEELG
jgi:di/tripeptidase